MANIKHNVTNTRNEKYGSILRIARITNANANIDMSNSQPRAANQAEEKGKERSQQALINAVEEQRLHNIAVRFQRVVVERNARMKGNERGDLGNPEMVHAGLIALENVLSDEDFYAYIIKGRKRE